MSTFNSINYIEPIKPVAPYIGGKSKLAKRIIAIINDIEHDTYAEAFVGMGGVFLRRNQRPKSEVINDFNSELAIFYRILQRHYVPFMEMMRYQITCRTHFERLVATPVSVLTDLERAARFLYMQRTAFGGKVACNNFGVSVGYGGRFDITKLGSMLDDLHGRMAGVIIECLSYEKFIPRYDRVKTLFYLDPPYFGNENDYGKGLFKRSDFEKLANILENIKGRFILSINDKPEIRAIFKAFDMDKVELNYSISVGKQTKASELIIMN